MNNTRTAIHALAFAAAWCAAPAGAQEFPRQMRIIVGSAGGTGPDFIARLIAPKLGESLRSNIHYKGGAAAAIAVMSGESDMTFTSYVVIAPHVESGRLRVLGVSSATRMPQLPNVPTIAENGLPGYEHEQWYGLFAPAKTPPALVQALHREVVRIVNTAEVNERLVSTGHRVIAGTPQQLADKVRLDIEKTRRIMQASGMQQQ